MLYNAIKTSISFKCHSVKRLSRLPCAVCTLERRCQLTSKDDHDGRHASREVCELIRIETSLAFREAARARLAWRDRHPCVRTIFYGVITAALTLFRYIHFDFTAPLADGLGQGTGTRTATGGGHWTLALEHALALGRALALALVPHVVCGITAIQATVTVARTISSG